MIKKPEIIVFAGPNGSGKSTVTAMARVIQPYINADDIKRHLHCTDLEAAQYAEKLRRDAIKEQKSFSFETVLSTDRNLNLLKEARRQGYFIRCIYVLTANPTINIIRVKSRVQCGGHDVPEDKIIRRYHKALALLPELVAVCDVCHLYDNSDEPIRIFKKRKDKFFVWQSAFWSEKQILQLVGLNR